MTEFDNLKSTYIAIVQLGLTTNVSYQEVKLGNELLHKFCESFVENSNYLDSAKTTMKQELELIKEALSEEIESYYQHK